MSLKKQVLSSGFWSLLQLFGMQGIRLVVSMTLARLLLPAELGLIVMLGIFMGLASTHINSVLTSSLIRIEELDELDFSAVFF